MNDKFAGVEFERRELAFLEEAIKIAVELVLAGKLPHPPKGEKFGADFWEAVRDLARGLANQYRTEDVPSDEPDYYRSVPRPRTTTNPRTRLDVAWVVVAALVYQDILRFDMDYGDYMNTIDGAIRVTAGVLRQLIPYQGEDTGALPFDY